MVYSALGLVSGRVPFRSTITVRWGTLLAINSRWLHPITLLRTPPDSLRSRQRPHCSENKHSTQRQEFLGHGSENLEQSTCLTAAAWHWIWTL